MREFGTEFIPSPPQPETREQEAERAREVFLRPARAFEECSRELFVSGKLDHEFIEQISAQHRLGEEYRFALYGFADSARMAGVHVDLLLNEQYRETGSYELNDKAFAQSLLKFTPRYDCTIEPNELGFTVVFTHPADYLQWYWGQDEFSRVMSQRAEYRRLPADDLTALPRALYHHASAAAQRHDEANHISILATHLNPQDPQWGAHYLQYVCHEWRHAANQVLIPKIGETAHAHERAQGMVIWALQSNASRRTADDAAYGYLQTLKEYGQFSLANELLAKSGNQRFSKHEAIQQLSRTNHEHALYDYHGKSMRAVFQKALPHGTPTVASRMLQSTLAPRIRELQRQHIETVQRLASSFDAARIRLRLNPEDLSAGMAMQAAVSDRFDDFLDRVQQLAGQ